VAACALILLAYTYFGYPLLLGLLARLVPGVPARPDLGTHGQHVRGCLRRGGVH